MKLEEFIPESAITLSIPQNTPDGIKNEFREAEKCLSTGCYRAAAGLFRSTIDKTMRANGYKTNKERNLYLQIEAAAKDGVITSARKKRAHDEIRVLGNDVLHDEWYKVEYEDVKLSHRYTQRILEDFYDERDTVEEILAEVGRIEKNKT